MGRLADADEARLRTVRELILGSDLQRPLVARCGFPQFAQIVTDSQQSIGVDPC
jgi:hypothetical protein